jgi:hypothetical protein
MTPHTLDTVEFSVGDEGRVGLLHLPEGSGWYPAVVVIGEAADGPEAPLTDFLADSGYAVLTFDEPGAGLAAAALAAADSLLMRPDIRADVIGLLGLGEGAWVAAFAAARVPETAFAVLLPGDTAVPAGLERLANVYCPVLAFAEEPGTAAALAGALAHNPDVVFGPVGADGLTEAALLAVLGPWLQRQAA